MTQAQAQTRRAVADDLTAILRVDHVAASEDHERAEFLRHCLNLGEGHVYLDHEALVFTSTNTSNRPMRALLAADDWSFSGELDGLDEGDPELVFYKSRPAGLERRTD